MTQLIRNMRALMICLLMGFAVPVSATAQQDPSAEYEILLDALRTAQSQSEADLLSAKIWDHWLTAPNEAAQAVLDAAMDRRQAYDFAGAIAELDRLVEFYPDYAEGWNQRATMYFMTGEFDKSLADVEEVLTREPRHFGALAGKGMILFQQGKLPLAQIAVREGLKHHPFLRERAILDSNPGTEL